ncbi:hypothetical protein AB0H92_44750 [Streptomyces phaeochromogenes]|uniref:hypothetical protein n=1 Tax=Streptomyces phaeochromogenes TaxID=1923 RepID=UPI0034072A00
MAKRRGLAEASPRTRAMQLPDLAQRGFAFTAAGAAARIKCVAEYAIKDTLAFVPFRQLPPRFKWQMVRTTVQDKLEYWWLRTTDAVGDAWRVLRRRRS